MIPGPRLHPATILAQLDHFTDPATGSLVPPLQPGITSRTTGSDTASEYGRSGNTGTALLERVMALLDGGAAAACFNSAAGAAAALLAGLRPGDHLLLDSGMYYEFADTFTAFGARWGVAVDRADLTDPAAVEAALRPGQTRLVWGECPSNPLWRVPDIAALATASHAAGALLLIDATVATPVLCQPLRLGADLVLHSGTKYLNGHGDLLAGVLVTAEAGPRWYDVLGARMDTGSVLPPFEAWLLARGLRTLAIRMERVSATALRVATLLQGHGSVTRVHYPGLDSDPWHAVAVRQMTGGFGGMVSFQLADADTALAACGRFRVFRRATSLGSTESLVEHRLSVEGPASRCPPGLIRLSIGLEHPDDLLADLVGALDGSG